MKDSAVAVALVSALIGPGWVAAQPSPARTYGAAMAWYAAAAAEGHAEALYFEGFRAETGEGRARDALEAERLYEPAARAGHASAGYRLGLLLTGRGAAENALPWLKGAAESGHVAAQSLLGYLLAGGAAGAIDPRNGAYWLERAARAGDATAAVNLERLAPLLDGADRAAVAARLAAESQP